MSQLGPDAVVRVAVTTLWTGPDRVRPVDGAVVRVPADVRGWTHAMTPADREDLHDRALSQLLLGEHVLVTDVSGDWAHVIATGQPSGDRDPRGYPGWLPAAHLVPVQRPEPGGADRDPAGMLVVDATSTALRDEPDGDVALPGVALGTRLQPAGTAVYGWLPVLVPGHDDPLWARERDLCPAPGPGPEPAVVLATAERLLDTVYVWGGLTGYGIDCSGLVHLAWRRHGVALPRDAHDQAAATRPVPLGEERPGDLYFFGRPGQRIHHVALVAEPPAGDERTMVHACGTRGRVVREPLAGERAATLVAAHRVATG